MTTETKTMINLRAKPSDVERIDMLADKQGMSRTEYMIRAALGDLQPESRLDQIEKRLSALETLT